MLSYCFWRECYLKISELEFTDYHLLKTYSICNKGSYNEALDNSGYKNELEYLDANNHYINRGNHHDHHHVMPSTRISLTLSFHPSLSFIAFGRSTSCILTELL